MTKLNSKVFKVGDFVKCIDASINAGYGVRKIKEGHIYVVIQAVTAVEGKYGFLIKVANIITLQPIETIWRIERFERV